METPLAKSNPRTATLSVRNRLQPPVTRSGHQREQTERFSHPSLYLHDSGLVEQSFRKLLRANGPRRVCGPSLTQFSSKRQWRPYRGRTRYLAQTSDCSRRVMNPWRTNMKPSPNCAIRAASFVIAAIGALGVTAALAGGNGNGGNGSGGAHGAATSGMTYHSEPVSSPWNRPFGDASKYTIQGDAETTAAHAARDRTTIANPIENRPVALGRQTGTR